MKRELLISVDVEAAGPIPGEFSLLSIGACHVDEPERTFACELKPINMSADPKAPEVSGLSLEALARTGLDPVAAMAGFEKWLFSGLGPHDTFVFVGLNAPFDWSFVNYYFHRFLGRNPFGFTALDIKAYYMGAIGCRWAETTSNRIASALTPTRRSNHNALHAAQYQAELFRLIRAHGVRI
jgi:DNA polymerase III epsilon subunit-like protein